MSEVNEEMLKLSAKHNIHIHELGEDSKDVYINNRENGGFGMQSNRDTHFLMRDDKVIFIGNKPEILGFMRSNL